MSRTPDSPWPARRRYLRPVCRMLVLLLGCAGPPASARLGPESACASSGTRLAASSPALPNSATRPDLIVSRLEVPTGLRQGDCNAIDVTVENLQPHGTTQSITVRLHLQFATNGESQYVKVLNGIAANGQRGSSQRVRFDAIPVPAAGRVTYSAAVNPDGVVPETVVDERNAIAGTAVVTASCVVPRRAAGRVGARPEPAPSHFAPRTQNAFLSSPGDRALP